MRAAKKDMIENECPSCLLANVLWLLCARACMFLTVNVVLQSNCVKMRNANHLHSFIRLRLWLWFRLQMVFGMRQPLTNAVTLIKDRKLIFKPFVFNFDAPKVIDSVYRNGRECARKKDVIVKGAEKGEKYCPKITSSHNTCALWQVQWISSFLYRHVFASIFHVSFCERVK